MLGALRRAKRVGVPSPALYRNSVPTTPRRAVYLDINHWYALGEALAGHPKQPEHLDVLRQLTEFVEQGQLMFPLSAVHYIELSENPRDHQRGEAANVMARLSRFNTLTSAGKIIDEEIALGDYSLTLLPDVF